MKVAEAYEVFIMRKGVQNFSDPTALLVPPVFPPTFVTVEVAKV